MNLVFYHLYQTYLIKAMNWFVRGHRIFYKDSMFLFKESMNVSVHISLNSLFYYNNITMELFLDHEQGEYQSSARSLKTERRGMRWTTVTDGKFLQKSVNASKELFGSSSAADFPPSFRCYSSRLWGPLPGADMHRRLLLHRKSKYECHQEMYRN